MSSLYREVFRIQRVRFREVFTVHDNMHVAYIAHGINNSTILTLLL